MDGGTGTPVVGGRVSWAWAWDGGEEGWRAVVCWVLVCVDVGEGWVCGGRLWWVVGWRGRMGWAAGMGVTPTLLLNIGTRDWGAGGVGGV